MMTAAKARRPEAASVRDIPPGCTARAAGWIRMRALDRDVAEYLPPLLKELREEACVHSWRSRLPAEGPIDAAAARQLLEDESARRPTRTFVYLAERLGGGEELVAVGCVSERISASFAHEGFPVIARCFLRPHVRHQGLYEPILRHRFDWCRVALGPRLAAVHLGSTDGPVDHVARDPDRFEPPFLWVGEEQLAVGADSYPVHDLLAFSAAWRDELVRELRGFGSGPAAGALHEHVVELTTRGKPRAGLAGLPPRVAAAEAECGARRTDVAPRLVALMDFAAAVPVLS